MEKKPTEIKGVHQKNSVYVLNEKVIGSGGAGKVFTGFIKNSQPLTKLAIKKIPEDVIRKIRKDYERQVFQKLLEVPHRHLCYTYDIVEHRRHECRYIVMELVQGGNLSDFMKTKKGVLSMKTIKRFFKHIVYGLEALKRERIIHRDLKPENILLTKDEESLFIDEESCILKICDFGTSKVIMSGIEDLTQTRGCMGIGTPGYSAPELYLDHTGTSYDRRVDLWSMGCLLHFLCFGIRPFKVGGRNYRALWNKVYKGLQFDGKEVKKRKIGKDALNLMLALCRYDKDAKPPWKKRMNYEEFMKDPFVLSCLEEGESKEEVEVEVEEEEEDSSEEDPKPQQSRKPVIPKRSWTSSRKQQQQQQQQQSEQQPKKIIPIINKEVKKLEIMFSKEEYSLRNAEESSYRLFFQDDEMRKLASRTKSLIYRDCKRSISIGNFGYFLEFEKKDYPHALVLYTRSISLLSRHLSCSSQQQQGRMRRGPTTTRGRRGKRRRVRRGSVIRIPNKYEGWVSARLEELKERANEVKKKMEENSGIKRVEYFESLVLTVIKERMKNLLSRSLSNTTTTTSSYNISQSDLAVLKYSSCILTYISRYKKWKKPDIFLINNYIHAFGRVIYLAEHQRYIHDDEEDNEDENEGEDDDDD